MQKKPSKKSLSLTTSTLRSLQHEQLATTAGGSGYETWFLTVCAPCASHPCGSKPSIQ